MAFQSELPSLAVLAAMGALAIRCWYARLPLVCGVLTGLLWSASWGHLLLSERLPEHCSGQWFVVEGLVSSLPRQLNGELEGQQFVFSIERWLDNNTDCDRPREVWVTAYRQPPIAAGSVWQVELRLRSPRGLSNPAGFDRLLWLVNQGIDATGTVRKDSLKPLYAGVYLRGYLHHLRQRVRDSIDVQGFDPAVGALLAALSVGDKSGLDNSMNQALRTLGLSHLAVISGLHIGFAAGLGWVLGRVVSLLGLGDGRRVGILLGVLIATLYGLLAGLGLPCVRALIMLYVMAGCLLSDARPPLWFGFAVAVTGVLLWQPLALISTGFWLSFGAVAALLSMAQRWRHLSRWRVALLMQLFVSLLMTVLSARFFDGFSAVMLLTNSLLIPLVSLVLVPAVLVAGLLSLLDSHYSALVWNVPAWVLEQLIEGFRMASHWLPPPWIALSPTFTAVVLAGIAFVLLLLPAFAGIRTVCVVLLLPLILPRNTELPPGRVNVWVFDVGQGTAVFVRTPDHRLLYDTGGGDPGGFNMAQAVILPFMRQSGMTWLDTLVISHADNDHSAGAHAIEKAVTPTQTWSGAPEFGRACVAGKGWPLTVDGQVSVRFLAPFEPYSIANRNNSSCVLQLRAGSFSLLLPGDIDADLERRLVRHYGRGLASDVLLLAHHGSHSSSSYAWLKAVTPRLAIASAGFSNRFGHPHTKVKNRLRQLSVPLMSTAEHGAVHLQIDKGVLTKVSPWRYLTWRYWY